ncbi:MAG: spore maturation protein [Clostridia bacterium]|nr:spore maturation protein [Clostridia bacterium]
MVYVFSAIVPLFILITIVVGLKNKLDVLKLFTDGVLKGLKTALSIFPYILAITIAITLLQETGVMNFLIKPIKGLLANIGVPESIIPLALFRPLSGGASMSVVMDIFKRFGPDSMEGKIASIIMGGTETTFYVTTVLFGAVKVKKVRGTIVAAIIADIVAVVAAIILVNVGFI